MSSHLSGMETSRLRALRRYAILDTEPEPVYDDIVALAARVCHTGIALITFVDRDRIWFKATRGITLRQAPRENAFCDHAINNLSDITIINDADRHPRFARHPMVVGEPFIRFYAAVPLLTTSREALGNLCVLDVVPHELDELQRETLRFLASQVMIRLESRRTELSRHVPRDAVGIPKFPDTVAGGIDYASPNVTSTKEWVERCVAQLLLMDPDLDPVTSVASVHELSLQRQWRLKRPEAAAEELFEQAHQGVDTRD